LSIDTGASDDQCPPAKSVVAGPTTIWPLPLTSIVPS
jgi:hypothetical protein